MEALKNYFAPVVTDRGSVVARTLGHPTTATLEPISTFAMASTDVGLETAAQDKLNDHGVNKTYERNADGSVRLINGNKVEITESLTDDDG